MPEEASTVEDFPRRKFGIELETLSNISRAHLVRICKDALRSNGYNTRVQQVGYCHDGPQNRTWKWKTDASCGFELTSPVLSGWRGLHELSVIMEAVDGEADAQRERLIDRRCGVHIHVNAKDLNWAKVKNIAVAMKVWEPLFYAINPHSRKTNTYCVPIKWDVVKMKNARSKDEIRSALDRQGANRYCALNMNNWWRTGTIEFRYFAGTFAFEKAAAAIMLSVLFVDTVARKSGIRISDEQLKFNFNRVWDAAGRIGFNNYVEKFFRDLLCLRSGACPAFRELKRYVLARIDTFYENNGRSKNRRSPRRRG